MVPSEHDLVCVIGAGTMGSQIAQQCALHGFDTILVDTDQAQLESAQKANRAVLERRVQKGRLARQEMEDALARVQVTTRLDQGVASATFVVEAVVERVDVKRSVFSALDAHTSAEAVLATNSSTIAISQICTDVRHPERCLNMHFFHPALVMQLVEIMRGPQTADWAAEAAMEFGRKIGREPILINREIYGLVVNRILGAMKREAFWLAEEGYATPEDIDRAVKLGLNHPMGPFELSDFSGLDVYYYAALHRYQETGDEQFKPPRILEEKVRAGHLGRKTGKGFYDYPAADE